ncbi:MAG: diguanylate cyclase, partial [Clostridia bacterium]|nr:diguanylate cyclase [Clostridia bacterium]
TRRKNGIIRWYQVRSNLFSRTKESHIITTLILDATERKNMDQELKLQAERLNLLSDVEGEHIFDYNAKSDVLLIKASKENAEEHDIIIPDFMQKEQYSYIFEEDKAFFIEFLEACMKSPKRDNLNVRMNLFESGYRWYRILGSSILGNEGYVTRMVGRITDIHEDKLKEIELEIKAEKDTLTQTYNKGATEHIITGILSDERNNHSDKLHALLVIDLDNFKAINDNLGHAYGDLVLSEAAGKMKDMFKGHDVVGRVGGDEFVIFMYDVEDVRNVYIIARKLCKLLSTKYPCVTGDIPVTSSIGIAVCQDPFPEYIDLFNQADAAMYVSKNSGKNGCTLYGDDM